MLEPNGIYTTTEVEKILKISKSTVKRLLKRGILRANKVGGQYRVLGKEMIRLLAPDIERKSVDVYQKVKKNIKKKIKNW